MLFLAIAFLAGVLTVLAPCILPLLPIVVGSTDPSQKTISRRAVVVIASLSLSVIIFTLLLKASTLLIDIPPDFWKWFSGSVIIIVGIAILFPEAWSKVPGLNKISTSSNQTLTAGYQRGDFWGSALMGFALGPVFTTCSPTYFFIIASVLPASFAVGFSYLLAFTAGLALVLLLVAYFGQRFIGLFTRHIAGTSVTKKIFGVLIIIIGISIITGYDKKFEAWILDSGYGATINFEESLIDRFGT